MQPVDLTKFPNTGGWHIIHDSDNMVYKIKSGKGQTKNQVFTQRRFAEKALYNYLEEMAKPTQPVGRPKGAKNKVKPEA